MSRTDETDTLRSCPTCGTEVSETQLGLRDYSRWSAGILPGRVGGSDIDFVLEQHQTERVLFVEFKPAGAPLPVGQRLLLTTMVRKGIDVWVVWEYKDGRVEAGTMDKSGEVRFIESMHVPKFARKVQGWWQAGLEAR